MFFLVKGITNKKRVSVERVDLMKWHFPFRAIMYIVIFASLSFAGCRSEGILESHETEGASSTMTDITTEASSDNTTLVGTTASDSKQETANTSNTATYTKKTTVTKEGNAKTISTQVTTKTKSTTETTYPPFVATKRLENIWIRDPYIVASKEEGVYYMFGTTYNSFSADGGGFMYYKSYDQKLWAGPYDAFNAVEAEIGNRYTKYWAPEIHRYQDDYYMFATFGSNTTRHSVILKSTTGQIGGPYAIHFDHITPTEWSALDATLYVENGEPWMVYCREWVGIANKDGEMYAQRLSKDLKSLVGERRFLFKGSDAPGQTTNVQYVTDGPFLHKGENGILYMLWSTGIKGMGYTTLAARSSNGKMSGEWTQDKTLLYTQDGGHPMVYKDLSGNTCVAIHTPNSNTEHAEIFTLTIDKNGNLNLIP